MTQARIFTAALALMTVIGGASYAETIQKKGKTATGETCSVTVEKHADGRITATGSSSTSGVSSSTSGVAGGVSSSSSAGGSSVNVQAGGGNVSSSTSTSGGPGSVSASTMTVNGCTISTSSP